MSDSDSDSLDRVASGGITIYEAIVNGLTDVVEQLLDEGLNPNMTASDGTSILFIALRNRRYDIVRLLLDRGADPNIRLPVTGYTPIFETIDPNIADMLIRYGADVNIKDNRGETFLAHLTYSNIPLIKLLVARGADVNTTDNEGKTPLIKSRSPVLVELLLRLGADPDIRDNSGNKASYYAPESSLRKSILQMAEKRFSKKGILPSKLRVTAHWMEICNTLGNAGVYDLRKLIADNTDGHNFSLVSQFFTSNSFDDVYEFLDYIQGLSKREICAGLAKYYTATKPEFLSVEYVRGSVRPLSEMARKSIQSKRKKASLYSLAYRKARQADPEKFREYVSQFDLPNL
jgi:ankyrin repeat protein